MSLSVEQVRRVFKYIETNIEDIIKQEAIRTLPYYPGRSDMELYFWYIINIPKLGGDVKFYYTSSSTLLIINDAGAWDAVKELEPKEYEKTYELVRASYNRVVALQIDKLLI